MYQNVASECQFDLGNRSSYNRKTLTMGEKDKTSYLSKEKHKELTEELKYLQSEKRKEIAEKLEYVKSLGDLSENSEYQELVDANPELVIVDNS